MRRFLTSSRRRAQFHAARPFGTAAEHAPLRRWTAHHLTILALAAACGPAPTEFIGTDFSADDDIVRDGRVQDEMPRGLEDVVTPSVPPLCVAPFEACGGKLAGVWRAEETCNSATYDPKALQIWGKTVMGLDTTACWNAVELVTSEFMGELRFEMGEAHDTRMRRDTITMTLNRGCLNATLKANIKQENVSSVCRSLTDDMTNCTTVNGACSCTKRRENEIDDSRIYGVLGTNVVLGSGEDREWFDYCVAGDLLTWREQGSPRHVVLRRDGAPSTEADPPPR